MPTLCEIDLRLWFLLPSHDSDGNLVLTYGIPVGLITSVIVPACTLNNPLMVAMLPRHVEVEIDQSQRRTRLDVTVVTLCRARGPAYVTESK